MSETQDPAIRGEQGRFRPGCPGGPGRPKREIEQDYIAVLGATVSLERWTKICLRAAEDAEKGDARAREWLGGFMLGKPTGDLLLKVAAGQRAGIDPVRAAAHHIALEALTIQLFADDLKEIEGDEPKAIEGPIHLPPPADS